MLVVPQANTSKCCTSGLKWPRHRRLQQVLEQLGEAGMVQGVGSLGAAGFPMAG